MAYPSAHGLSALHFLWSQYEGSVSYSPVSKGAWIDEFFFCLLGGYGITYEHNLSAFDTLNFQGLLEPALYEGEMTGIESLLEKALRTPQFSPPKKNGELRVYRYYRQKAKVLALAGRWLYRKCCFCVDKLLVRNPALDRQELLDCPGFGFKTASWYLRNIGHGYNLAILDVHVHRVLADFEIIPVDLSVSQNYLEIEEIFIEACDSIGASTDVMDLILWNWDRVQESRG